MDEIPLERMGTVADSGEPCVRVKVQGSADEGFFIVQQRGESGPIYDDWVRTEAELQQFFAHRGWKVRWDTAEAG